MLISMAVESDKEYRVLMSEQIKKLAEVISEIED